MVLIIPYHCMQTCFDRISAVSKATMSSYGAFCAEFHALHKERTKPRAAREKHAKKAYTKRRAARAIQNTIQTPYQNPLPSPSQTAKLATRRTPDVRPGHLLILSSLLSLLSNAMHGDDATHRDVTGAKSRTKKFIDFAEL